MKHKVTFKTPDVFADAVEEVREFHGEEEAERFEAMASRYIRFGEYVTLEFDTSYDEYTPPKVLRNP